MLIPITGTDQVGTAKEKPESAKGLAANTPKKRVANNPKNVQTHKWKKGVSGNPRGRPKKDFLAVEEAQKHGLDAINTLAKIMKDDEQAGPTRVSAASTLLERGFGKAPQKVDLHATLGISEEFEKFLSVINEKAASQGNIKKAPSKVIDADFTTLIAAE